MDVVNEDIVVVTFRDIGELRGTFVLYTGRTCLRVGHWPLKAPA